jgi:hypothetical protein
MLALDPSSICLRLQDPRQLTAAIAFSLVSSQALTPVRLKAACATGDFADHGVSSKLAITFTSVRSFDMQSASPAAACRTNKKPGSAHANGLW